MAHVHIPRSLAALFPGLPRRLDIPAHDLAGLILELDARYQGAWDRLCEPGPRLRRHINAFVTAGQRPSARRSPPTAMSTSSRPSREGPEPQVVCGLADHRPWPLDQERWRVSTRPGRSE